MPALHVPIGAALATTAIRAPWLVLLAMASVAGTVGATDDGGGTGRVTGTVGYRERVALPPTAVITVQLVDVSLADAPAVVLGEQVIRANGKQVPVSFDVSYDPARIEAHRTYAVQARIEDGGALRFINDQRYAVITRGAPAHVDLVLKDVRRPPSK